MELKFEANRRDWIVGGASAALLTSGFGARAADHTSAYDYAFLDFNVGTSAPVRPLLSEYMKSINPSVRNAGGRILGGFSPQIGWHSRQAAVLIEWPESLKIGGAAADAALASSAVATIQRTRLYATTRPLDDQSPAHTGMYTHRWFVVETRNVPEIVQLSTSAWIDFERDFDSKIFGLFQAEPTPADARLGQNRMLLMTGYRNYSVWEASREPDAAAKAAFSRRQQLTLDSWVASCLPVAAPI